MSGFSGFGGKRRWDGVEAEPFSRPSEKLDPSRTGSAFIRAPAVSCLMEQRPEAEESNVAAVARGCVQFLRSELHTLNSLYP